MKMSRAIAVMAGGLSLAACSFAMPSMDFFSSKPTTAPLSIESNPPGADARLSTGGTCRTPCSVTVPLGSEFSVTVALNGYTPETRTVRPVSAEASAGSPGATALLDPNPLFVELKPTAAPKPPPPPKKKRRRPIQAAAPAPAGSAASPPRRDSGRPPAASDRPPGRSGSFCVSLASPPDFGRAGVGRAGVMGKRKSPTLPSPQVGGGRESSPTFCKLPSAHPCLTAHDRLNAGPPERARSSAGEHSLHTGGVTGSIPVAPTIKAPVNRHFLQCLLPFPPRLDRERIAKLPQRLGENAGTLFAGRSAHSGTKSPELCSGGVQARCGDRSALACPCSRRPLSDCPTRPVVLMPSSCWVLSRKTKPAWR